MCGRTGVMGKIVDYPDADIIRRKILVMTGPPGGVQACYANDTILRIDALTGRIK